MENYVNVVKRKRIRNCIEMKDKKFKNSIDADVLEKHFEKGDILIVTSKRSGTEMGICDTMWVCKYDHDVTYEEVVKKHYENTNKYFPSMNITFETVKKALNPKEKYFITTEGDIRLYSSHEKADIFDIYYLNNDVSKTKLAIIKDKYVCEFNVKQTIYIDDEWPHYRVFDDITEWINQKMKEDGTN